MFIQNSKRTIPICISAVKYSFQNKISPKTSLINQRNEFLVNIRFISRSTYFKAKSNLQKETLEIENLPIQGFKINSKILKTVKEYRDIYPECVLLTRVGDFYEMYYNQADDIGGKLLGLQVVDKKYGKGSVRFTGFPSRSIEKYLEQIVGTHKLSVALCEQFKLDGKYAFYRKVSRIITPGTWIAQRFNALPEKQLLENDQEDTEELDIYENNQAVDVESTHQYLVVLSQSEQGTKDGKSCCSLAWLDVTTGDFYTSTTSVEDLMIEMVRIRPREIVINNKSDLVIKELQKIYPFSRLSSLHTQSINGNNLDNDRTYIGPTITIFDSFFFANMVSLSDLKKFSSSKSLQEIEDAMSDDIKIDQKNENMFKSVFLLLEDLKTQSMSEYIAARTAINYIILTQIGNIPVLQPPTRFNQTLSVKMSPSTISALELVKPIDAAYAGASVALPNSLGSSENKSALITEILHTKTRSGSRLLSEYLVAPSASIQVIENRLDLVEFFYSNSNTRTDIRNILSRIKDFERSIQRISIGYRSTSDILDIAASLEYISKISHILKTQVERSIRNVVKSVPGNENDLSSSFEKVLFSDDFWKSEPLQLLKRQLILIYNQMNLLDPLEKLIKAINDTVKIKNDEVDTFGLVNPECNVTLRKLLGKYQKKYKEKDDFQSRMQLQYNVSSLRIKSISALGSFIEVSRKDSTKLVEVGDLKHFQSLKGKSRYYHKGLSLLISELDILKERITTIEKEIFDNLFELRLAEKGIQFVGNDCYFDEENSTILLTGPNMGGKSTYLRQVALTSIMGQMGCFVPASRAILPIVDSIYSRIGAHDNLALNQSTFMVEMLESADILKNATEKSLVIMDEIGRGTSTADGMALAYASLMYLHQNIKCKTLFATHYHEITGLFDSKKLSGIKMMHTAIIEYGMDNEGYFSYIHKVLPGICEKSHGIYVAQSAGVPKPVIEMAKKFTEKYNGIPGLVDFE
ncbi:hypothetical protein BB559_000906 [Furculomyces boomerangus]|uniref:DNA mismatch repair proteins mutS family domain-containing protein n=1 Tax=Furculomyces boomerangus TaxID=61424 RepID=A0A2T9Z3X4_9FUNG|nr:hypothetical protein BB559_000906 [Furculomyces boomerangus]